MGETSKSDDNLTTEQALKVLEELVVMRDGVIQSRAEVKARRDQAQREMAEIDRELAKEGTKRETVATDLQNAKRDLVRQVVTFRDTLTLYRDKVASAQAALAGGQVAETAGGSTGSAA
ncbi:MAG: hypothetical protein E6R03_16375 [Hyphomicrobiaceae bacterium]|nr:MAG: hypothetical protein E6R03_16375 [Hyphomicrobiaceae bacterium]